MPAPLARHERRLEINESDRAVLTLKTQARKLEQQRQRVRAACRARPAALCSPLAQLPRSHP